MDTQKIKFGVITVSDSCFAKKNEDKSGVYLKTAIETSKLFDANVLTYEIVPDELTQIYKTMSQLCESPNGVDVIISNGGTGFAERDVTPEATKCVIEKEAIGIVTALISRSLNATPLAALSRLTAGIKNRTLIVNFPGSLKAVKECWEVLEPLITHAVHHLREDRQAVTETHSKMQHDCSHQHHHHHHDHQHHHHHHEESSVDVSSPASRPRESQYPMITVDQALQIINDHAKHGEEITEVALMDSLSYCLARDIYARDPQPPFPASIKDGYAVVTEDGDGLRKVIGSSLAGSGDLPNVTKGYCMRISTGAPVPPGADAVVQVEDTELVQQQKGEELEIKILIPPKLSQDIRPVGSDVAEGECVLKKGIIIGSAEIGILASVGQCQVPVFKKPEVVVMSTGNELEEPQVQQLPFGKIRDSNRFELVALLKQHGFDSIMGVVALDEPKEMLLSLKKAFETADILVTSGGVSMGEKDLLKQILVKDLGFTLHFARVFMKPGKPTTFATGVFDGTKKIVFGLPGNPVSAWVTAQLYVIPTLRRLSGYPTSSLTQLKVQLLEDFQLDPRPEYCRAICVISQGSNTLGAMTTGSNQMSSRLTSNREANLLLKLPPRSEEKKSIRHGDIVDALVIGAI